MFTRIGSTITKAGYNGNLDALELQNSELHGKGVIKGLELLEGDPLTVDVSPGVLLGLSAENYAGGSIVVPDNATSFIWLENGTLSLAASGVDPGGQTICLGSVIVASGVMTFSPVWRMVAGQKNPQVILLHEMLEALNARVTALEP